MEENKTKSKTTLRLDAIIKEVQPYLESLDFATRQYAQNISLGDIALYETCRGQLIDTSVNFNVLYAEVRSLKNNYEHGRKVLEATIVEELVRDGMKITQAGNSVKGQQKYLDYMRVHSTIEKLYNLLYVKHEQINNSLSAISQTIALHRNENKR